MDMLRVGSKMDMSRLIDVITSRDVPEIASARTMNISVDRFVKKGVVLMCTSSSIIELDLGELEMEEADV